MSDVWGLKRDEYIAPGLIAISSLGGGEIYEAWVAFDERLYAPVVAKVVRPSYADHESVRADLVREVELLSRLNHPGVVRVFSYDDEGPRPYLVLENVDGPNLSSLISEHGYLPIHQLLPLGLELCSTLHFLHGQGVCHLDIKPSNVIMGAPAKLIDFNLALPTDEAQALDHPIGSDEYMAPEQCEPGVRGTVATASAMWSFGATMFRAAAGHRAWKSSPRWLQLTTPPKALPHFVPADLGELILACLDHDPAARPTATQVAQALEPMMDRLPTARLSGFKITL